MWFQYAPGGSPWVLTGLGSRKHRLIEAAGRFTLMVERSDPSIQVLITMRPQHWLSADLSSLSG